MNNIFYVGLGGMLGSVARYKTGAYFLHLLPNAKFPWGTFAVNVLGCLLIGVAAGFVERFSANNAELRLLLITGFLGGFTTFSAFGLETVHLIKSGENVLAAYYTFGSLIAGVLAVFLGLRFSVSG